jgi:hypothetical protein
LIAAQELRMIVLEPRGSFLIGYYDIVAPESLRPGDAIVFDPVLGVRKPKAGEPPMGILPPGARVVADKIEVPAWWLAVLVRSCSPA